MPVPVIVLNFGHSVLNSLEDYTQAASEIYRHYRQGQNVVAVTSAQGDQTDVLMAEARRIGPEGEAKNLPELLQLGCLLYTSPSPRDGLLSRMPSSA